MFGLLSTRCSSLAYPNNVKEGEDSQRFSEKKGATAISEQHRKSATAASKPGSFSTSCPSRSSNFVFRGKEEFVFGCLKVILEIATKRIGDGCSGRHICDAMPPEFSCLQGSALGITDVV